VSRDIVALLAYNATPHFIAPDLRPPNSPDLNPVDDEVWDVVRERLYRTRILDVALV